MHPNGKGWHSTSLSYTFVNDIYCLPFSPTFALFPSKAGGICPILKLDFAAAIDGLSQEEYVCACVRKSYPEHWQHKLQMLLDGFHILPYFLPWMTD